MAVKTITLNYLGNYGFVEFNDETKELNIQIPNHAEMAQKVREYLTAPHTMDIPGKQVFVNLKLLRSMLCIV